MGKKISIGSPQSEKQYLSRIRNFSDQVIMAHDDSVQQGFEYFESQEFNQANSKHRSLIMDKLFSAGLRNIPKMVKIFAKYMPSMMREIDKGFTDLEEYLDELESIGHILSNSDSLGNTCPNEEAWKELIEYAWEKWKLIIGFTEVPSQLIFKGKSILFRYALVCIQEMDKNKIDLAPELEAGEEVQRIYYSLGIAVNDIARWIRERYGVKCQSNHPLGGLVDLSPLAAKSGMGWQGCNGLLITPQFGQRNRIAPIFVQDKIFEFTDNNNHVWIEEFCRNCKKCQRSCPTQAIYPEKKISIQNVPGIHQTRTCIDRKKCFPQFNRTLGCSICIKTCPFSQGDSSYGKIRDRIMVPGTTF